MASTGDDRLSANRYGQTATWDGLEGTDTLYIDGRAEDAFDYSQDSTGAIHVDSASGASHEYHFTLMNVEKVQLGRNVIDLTLLFPADSDSPIAELFSPTNNASLVATDSNIDITFNEAIAKGTGSIVITDSSGVVETYDVATSANISIAANTLTINPTADLELSTNYSISIAAASIVDSAGNSYSGADSYSFTTSDTRITNGTAGDDTLVATAADEIVNGGSGTDSFQYSSQYAGHTITQTASGHQISSAVDGTDTVMNMERVQFSDYIVNLNIQDAADTISAADVQKLEELYVAFFNRVPDADGLEYWIGQFNSGQTINQIAESFYAAGIQYTELTGFSDTMSNTDFINVVYSNVLGRADGADTEGLNFWITELESGRETNGTLVSTILSAAHTYQGDATWGWVADLLDNKVSVADTFAVQHGLNYHTPEQSITGGMAIAAAVTEFGTDAAIELIGIIG